MIPVLYLEEEEEEEEEDVRKDLMFGIIKNKYYIRWLGDSRKYHPSKYDYQTWLRLGW